MNYAELRRYCRALVAGLGMSPPLDAVSLCARLAESRNRPIKLFPKRIPVDAAAGVLMVTNDRDLITYQTATTQSQQGHIIYHEVLHIVRNHVTGPHTLTCGGLLPELDAGPEPATQGRRLYEDWQEWEAETGATILSEWSYGDLGRLTGAPPRSARARRLYAALDDPLWD